MEEIREYKEQLTCPSCKVKKKDAVLTKCFHVFCLECLKTRYETRQRKCPKCNATFGANDYHRIYLEQWQVSKSELGCLYVLKNGQGYSFADIGVRQAQKDSVLDEKLTK